MIVKHKFSNLVELIRQGLVPPYIAEHVFANVDAMIKAFEKQNAYSFKGITGEIIIVEYDDV